MAKLSSILNGKFNGFISLLPADIGVTVQPKSDTLTSWSSKSVPSGSVVGTNDTQSLTNKTLNNPIIDGTVKEDIYAWTSTSGAVTTELEPTNGSIQTLTLTGNITSLTDNFSAGESITLMIDDGSGFTITWPTMTWVNNKSAAPILSTTKVTVITLWKIGSTLYGALVGDGA